MRIWKYIKLKYIFVLTSSKNHLMYQLLVYFDRFMHYHGLYTCTYIQNIQNNKNTNMIE